jgi:hypothetical protein
LPTCLDRAALFDQNAAHGFGRRLEIMTAAIPRLIHIATEPSHWGFMDERCRLDRLTRQPPGPFSAPPDAATRRSRAATVARRHTSFFGKDRLLSARMVVAEKENAIRCLHEAWPEASSTAAAISLEHVPWTNRLLLRSGKT